MVEESFEFGAEGIVTVAVRSQIVQIYGMRSVYVTRAIIIATFRAAGCIWNTAIQRCVRCRRKRSASRWAGRSHRTCRLERADWANRAGNASFTWPTRHSSHVVGAPWWFGRCRWSALKTVARVISWWIPLRTSRGVVAWQKWLRICVFAIRIAQPIIWLGRSALCIFTCRSVNWRAA